MEGVLLDGGINAYFSDPTITGNSGAGSGTYDGFKVAAAVSKFFIDGGVISQIEGYGNTQRYGVRIESGASDNYAVRNCNMLTNVTDSISDLGTGTNKVLSGNLPLNASYYQWRVPPGGQSGTAVSTTSASKTTLVTISIPPMRANSRIRIKTSWTVTSSGNSKTFYVDFGGTNFMQSSVSGAGSVTDQIEIHIQNRGATNSQVATAASGSWGAVSGALNTGAIDTTSAQNLVIAGSAAGGDTCTLEAYCVEVCHA
jgi:hypothetical protein